MFFFFFVLWLTYWLIRKVKCEETGNCVLAIYAFVACHGQFILPLVDLIESCDISKNPNRHPVHVSGNVDHYVAVRQIYWFTEALAGLGGS